MNFPNLDRSTAFMTPPCLGLSRLFLQLSSASFSPSSVWSSITDESIVWLVSSATADASSSDFCVSMRTEVFPVSMMKKLQRKRYDVVIPLQMTRSNLSSHFVQNRFWHPKLQIQWMSNKVFFLQAIKFLPPHERFKQGILTKIYTQSFNQDSNSITHFVKIRSKDDLTVDCGCIKSIVRKSKQIIFLDWTYFKVNPNGSAPRCDKYG